MRFPSKTEWPQIWFVASLLSLALLSFIIAMRC
jgi:hypothetical protein